MSAPEAEQVQEVEDTTEEVPAGPIPRSLMDYNISIPARDRRSNYLSLGKRDQILKKYENPKANFSDIKEANWYGDMYAGDDYKSHKWALGKDVDEPGFGSGVDDLARILLDAKKDVNTHTQCVFHIIRLRLIIFHTPKNFNGRNKIE